MAVATSNKRALDARKVRAARGWANLSQPELASRLELSVATIRRVEQGHRDVTTAELIRVGEICGVPRNFMLYGWRGEGKNATVHREEAQDALLADLARSVEKHERLHNVYISHARERGVDVGELITAGGAEVLIGVEEDPADRAPTEDLVSELESVTPKRSRARKG